MKRKEWKKPKLIILAKSDAQEMVLAACKNAGISPNVASDSKNSACYSQGSSSPT